MDSVCRVCLQNKNEKDEIRFISLFDGDEPSANKMMECAQVIVSHEDLLPKEICLPCADKLNIAYDFKMLCERSYHDLIDLIKGKGIPCHVEIKIEDLDTKMNIVCKEEEDSGVTEFSNLSNSNVIQPGETIKIEERIRGCKVPEKRDVQGKKNGVNLISGLELDEFDDDDTVGDDSNEMLDVHRDDVSLSNLLVPIKAVNVNTKNNGKKKKYIKKRTVEKTVRKSRKRLVCDQCGQTFTTRNSLVGHQRRHTGERLFVCSTCGKTFFVLNELKKHYNTHKAVKPYPCQYCDRRFADWGSRLKHERCHRGERPYSCDVCTKTFAYSYVLSRHKLTHTGAKNFSCEKCNKNFSVKYQLTKHNRKEHKEQSLDVENMKHNNTEVCIITESKPKKFHIGVKKKALLNNLL